MIEQLDFPGASAPRKLQWLYDPVYKVILHSFSRGIGLSSRRGDYARTRVPGLRVIWRLVVYVLTHLTAEICPEAQLEETPEVLSVQVPAFRGSGNSIPCQQQWRKHGPPVPWHQFDQWRSWVGVVNKLLLAVSLPSRKCHLFWRFCELPNMICLTT